MKRIRPFFFCGLFLLITAACASQDPAGILSVTPSPPRTEPAKVSSGTGTYFAIDEVGLGPDGYVGLTNFTDQAASLGGLFLCQGAKCFALPNVDVAPSATVRVAVGNGSKLDGVVATGATIGELRPSDGEIGLYSSQGVSDLGQTLAYLEWGSTPHGNTDAAIQAGLWIEGSFAPSSGEATHLFRTGGGLWLFEE